MPRKKERFSKPSSKGFEMIEAVCECGGLFFLDLDRERVMHNVPVCVLYLVADPVEYLLRQRRRLERVERLEEEPIWN